MSSSQDDVNVENANDSAAANNKTSSVIFEPKQKPKVIRVLTVMAYILSVSMAAILLSIYYIFMWDGHPHLGARTANAEPQRFVDGHAEVISRILKEQEEHFVGRNGPDASALAKATISEEDDTSVVDFQTNYSTVSSSTAEAELHENTTGVLLYGAIGLTCNSTIPLLGMDSCNKRRSDILRRRDPCGLMARSFYPLDVNGFPGLPIVFLYQLYTCVVISGVVLASTMCLIGLLIHGIAQLKHCRYLLMKIFTEEYDNTLESSREMANKMIFCIRYHITIINYAKHIDEAFSSMMFIHISLTSLVISVLGYELLMVDNAIDRIRFVMHLFGWLGLLFLTCFYGQVLIDESTGIARDAYRSKWYNGPVTVQKSLGMMIMRAQKPLTLSATSLGIMSYETFLKVLQSAYSYFTLLVTITD